jgi:ERCC4-type nuclease
MFTIDSRETKLIQICTERNLEFTKAFLDLGDILVHDYIIERKTKADLSASIKDNRFREQKERLSACADKYKIVYIIERNDQVSLPEKTLLSAIINLTIIYNFQVLWSNSPEETCDILQLLESKTQTHEQVRFLPPSIKKCDKLLKNALACQLNSIHGISWKIALKIQEEYKTMKNLIEEFSKDTKVLEKYGKSINLKIHTGLFTNSQELDDKTSSIL